MSNLLRTFVDFLAELRRRKVYRVAVAYIVVALGALQLVDIVVPSTRLPDWSGAFFIALAVFGFPVAIMLAWAFDLTPDGVERTSPPGPAEEHAAEGGEATTVSSAPNQARAAGDGSSRETPEVLDGDRPPRTDSRSHHDPAPRSLAVLPFETLGENEAKSDRGSSFPVRDAREPISRRHRIGFSVLAHSTIEPTIVPGSFISGFSGAPHPGKDRPWRRSRSRWC